MRHCLAIFSKLKGGLIIFTTVVFDLDGTLLDTIGDLAAAGNHTLRVLGLPIQHSTESYKQMVGHGIERLVQKFLPEKSQGPATHQLALRIFEEYYSSHLEDLTRPYPGIENLLEVLSAQNIKMAVLSNKEHSLACDIVERAFPGKFSFMQGLCNDYPKKPDPTSLLNILDVLGADFSKTLYCGDSGVDMQTAKSAKVPSCGVLWGFRQEEELTAQGADFIVASAEELQALILAGVQA